MITVRIEARVAQEGLAHVRRQIPFALSRACNVTAAVIARSVKLHVQAAFVLRQPRYILASIMVLRLADKKQGNIIGRNKAAAEVAVPELPPGTIGAAVGLHPNPLGGTGRSRPILERFERGVPKTGGVAIPTQRLRPTFADSVPRQFYPKNLGLEARRLISGGLGPSTRRYGAFVMGHPGEPHYGIYARVPESGDWGDRYVRAGKRKGQVRKQSKRAPAVPTKLVKLWHLRESVPIPARLEFYARAQPYLRAFRNTVLEELRKALRDWRTTGQTPSNRWEQPEVETADV